LKVIKQKFDDIRNGVGGGATRLLPRDGGVEELHEDPTVGPRPKT